MVKERSVNPAQAQRKADKQKEIAKSRKVQAGARNEKLAKRNPERLQRQIDELKEVEAGGTLRPKDKETLAQLEKDLRGVKRARDAAGDAAPVFKTWEKKDVRSEQRERRQGLGKRRRDDGDAEAAAEAEAGSETDDEVRRIPMPRDTPPPIPRQQRERFHDPQVDAEGNRVPHGLPAKPVPAAPPQITYGSAPQLRDLKKEAVRFMPSIVAQQKQRMSGKGGRLLEPEEADQLEKAGYVAAKKAAEEATLEAKFDEVSAQVIAETSGVDLDAEAKKFEAEMNDIFPDVDVPVPRAYGAHVEDVEDEDT